MSTADRKPDEIKLSDGTHIRYRPLQTDEVHALQRFHHRLSPHSVYLRFFGAKSDLSDRKARYFAAADEVSCFSLIVLDPEDEGKIIAVASFYREGETDRA